MSRSSMRPVVTACALLCLTFLASCESDTTTECCLAGQPGVRVVNAYTTPVDVLIDGNVAIASLAAGTVVSVAAASGNHTLAMRPTGAATSVSQSIAAAAGALSTIAALRATNGTLASAVLDDTGSFVPAGATKVRVLHLAPNAGVLQVYRTQPDYQTPIQWAFPFDYNPDPASMSFFQSTVGSWEIRVWKTPTSEAGWATATAKVVIPLASGEKKTVVILDNPAGGVRLEVF